MRLFINFSRILREMAFFYFICFSVISSILGIVIIVGSIKYYGNDKCVF